MAKNWTRAELLRKLLEADSDENVKLGYPTRPPNLPREVIKKWNEAAGTLYAAGLLWTWSTDSKLLVEYATASLERQYQIIHVFMCREPNSDPKPQIQKQKDNAAYWQHFQPEDIERLRLTPDEKGALRDWVLGRDIGPVRNAPPVVPRNDWKGVTPGIPQMPVGLSAAERAFWKNAALWVLLGGAEDGDDELRATLKEEGASDFFVDQLKASLPWLHRGLRPRT